jgi:hypothetical protein
MAVFLAQNDWYFLTDPTPRPNMNINFMLEIVEGHGFVLVDT